MTGPVSDVVGWVPNADLTEMHWSTQQREPVDRACPRTWPHGAHHWRTGEAIPAFSTRRAGFDCPGMPMITSDGREVAL